MKLFLLALLLTGCSSAKPLNERLVLIQDKIEDGNRHACKVERLVDRDYSDCSVFIVPPEIKSKDVFEKEKDCVVLTYVRYLFEIVPNEELQTDGYYIASHNRDTIFEMCEIARAYLGRDKVIVIEVTTQEGIPGLLSDTINGVSIGLTSTEHARIQKLETIARLKRVKTLLPKMNMVYADAMSMEPLAKEIASTTYGIYYLHEE